MRVLVALSGGVDSSVAAALLAEAGHEVQGVTLLQGVGTSGSGEAAVVKGAVRAAARLGIDHHVLDVGASFQREVVEPFAAAYRRGLTPNPCIECNRRVRFGALLDAAARLHCELVATGHYARIRREGTGYRLLRGTDRGKDQSYFLFMLGQEHLSRLAFPVGEMSKEEVRRRARALRLPGVEGPESQDLCFAGPGGYRAFLRENLPETSVPGPIVDTSGRELGRHEGIQDFTVGQRRGLGIAQGEARYVLSIDPATATLVVGGAADLTADGCRLGDVSWVAGEPPGRDGLEVKVRYRSPALAARLEPGEVGEWLVRFARPVGAVAPGQAAVLYRGDEVVGGGTILGTLGGGPGRRP